MDWQSIYQRQPDAIEKHALELFHSLFNAAARIHVFPNISSEVMSGAKSSYLKLQPNELLIAIFDETLIMRHAKDGFAFTTKRIYWKNQGEEPQVVEYSKLISATKVEGLFSNKMKLGVGAHIDVSMNKEIKETLVQFINRITAAYLNGVPVDQSQGRHISVTSDQITEWYISISGSQYGPYEESSIKSMLVSGQIVPAETLLWRQGMSDWKPFLQIPELAAFVQPAAPKLKTWPPPPPKRTDSQSFAYLDDALDTTTLPKAVQTEKRVDLNNASIDSLLTLPGINLSGAQKLIEERERLRGFDSFEEIGKLLELQPHQVEKLKVNAVINPYRGNGSATMAGKRIIDF